MLSRARRRRSCWPGRGAKRKAGGQQGHRDAGRWLEAEDRVDEIVEHYPNACRECRREFSADEHRPLGRFGRHQIVELPPISVLLVEHRTRRLRCPDCRVQSTAVEGAEVRGFAAAGEQVGLVLTRMPVAELTVAAVEGWRFGQVLLDAGALCAEQLRDAGGLLCHLNEAWFGYRSGDLEHRLAGEPRVGFDPAQTTLEQRLERKAAELGCSVSKPPSA